MSRDTMTNGAQHILGRATVFACIFCVLCAMARGQTRQPDFTPNYGQPGGVSREKGREILNDFRARGIEGDYYFEFQLRMRQRNSSATIVTPGRLWGSRNARGPVTRITLWPGEPDKELRLLVQNGPESAVWVDDGARQSEATGDAASQGAAMFAPLAGTELTPFEMQMPFVYWDDFIYEGIKAAASNRPAYTFVMRPPAAHAAARHGISGVRIFIETAFYAMGKFEVLGPGGKVIKTMTLKETPRINGQYIPGKVELRNDITRNATDLQVKLAAVRLELPREIFAPENLAKPVEPPPMETLWKAP